MTTIDRASSILDSFRGRPRLTLAEVVRLTGIPRSSSHRLLESLTVHGWLRRVGLEYELGPKLIEMGSAALRQHGLVRSSAPILRDLYRTTGLVVHFGVLVGANVLYLTKIGGAAGSALPTSAGGTRPAIDSAIGRALLAFSNDPRDVNDPRLSTDLAEVRGCGVAYAVGPGGIGSIAAPVTTGDGVTAAVSVCAPMARIRFDHFHSAPVRMAAASLSRQLVP